MSRPDALPARLAGLGLALCLLLPQAAQAGRSCEEQTITPATFGKAMAAAEQLRQKLDASGGDVAVIGRVGQDLSRFKLRYTHVGIAYRQPEGRWRVAHLLNDCGSASSDLWYEGLGNFFLDDMYSFESVALLPPPALAARLRERLQAPPRLRELHTPQYSLLAYPFATRYENSNTWVLETLAASASQEARIANREQAQMWLKLNGYAPSELKLGPLTRLGGRMFKANVAFDDHPNEMRYADRIQTVTVDSVMNFLQARKEGWQVLEIPAP
ncbi:DUF2145 domain-containing protein [Chromobacterium sp. LK1]|uniref:DUF2145 domain-containing protein n=1 Tax=Chromobacterium sp. LK1 TaxID=1628193 RepID=UPI001E401766|nr:DUF2145 domain-containing protein [Chromobacterium sp. LK1]